MRDNVEYPNPHDEIENLKYRCLFRNKIPDQMKYDTNNINGVRSFKYDLI